MASNETTSIEAMTASARSHTPERCEPHGAPWYAPFAGVRRCYHGCAEPVEGSGARVDAETGRVIDAIEARRLDAQREPQDDGCECGCDDPDACYDATWPEGADARSEERQPERSLHLLYASEADWHIAGVRASTEAGSALRLRFAGRVAQAINRSEDYLLAGDLAVSAARAA